MKTNTGISIDGCLLGWLRALKKAREIWVSTRTNDQTTFGCYDRAELKRLSLWGKQTEENRPSRQSSTPTKRRKQSIESVWNPSSHRAAVLLLNCRLYSTISSLCQARGDFAKEGVGIIQKWTVFGWLKKCLNQRALGTIQKVTKLLLRPVEQRPVKAGVEAVTKVFGTRKDMIKLDDLEMKTTVKGRARSELHRWLCRIEQWECQL